MPSERDAVDLPGFRLRFRGRILRPEETASPATRKSVLVNAQLSKCVARGFCGIAERDPEDEVVYLMKWRGATREEAERVVFRGEVDDE